MKRLSIFFLIACAWLVPVAAAPPFDHTILDNILKANVDEEGFVDYAGIRVNKGGDLGQYITILETVDVKSMPEEERVVFWINAYNAHVIRLILANPKLEKVSDDLGMFDKKFKIAKVNLTLNQIEHQVLRADPEKGGRFPTFSIPEFDSRIHFTLVCGAIDCPKLWNRAYTSKVLKERLQANAAAFANSPKHFRIENGRLVVSSLMKWYGKDFDKLGGVIAFLSSLTDPEKRPDADEIDAKLQTDFPVNVDFPYDWTLNDIKNKKKK